jgi:mono/diheme cytochrome c family protein
VKIGLALFAALVAALAIAGWVLTAPQPLSAGVASAMSEPGDPAAGRVVYYLAGCGACHSSGPADSASIQLGGGAELKTPFGSFYPPNISPDPIDGIGKWTAQDFANAVMAGVSPADEHLYPAFPYPSYRHMAVKDVRDLYAFLKTTTPVSGKRPPNTLSFPFSIRRAVGVWKLLYLPGVLQPPAIAPEAVEERGRYLVEGPGHCGECHSPRSFLGGVIADRRLTGATLPDGKKAPNITASGLKKWSEQDIADALSTGLTPDGDVLAGAMAEVVTNLAHAPAADLSAMAHYLKTFQGQ